MQAVTRQVQVADDLRPQQAHHVGEHRETETREDLLAHRRAADALAALDDQNALAGAREIGSAHQAVVAAADDDDFVLVHTRFRSGSKKGFFTTCTAARLRWCSTVISMSRAVPGFAHAARRCASAI